MDKKRVGLIAAAAAAVALIFWPKPAHAAQAPAPGVPVPGPAPGPFHAPASTNPADPADPNHLDGVTFDVPGSQGSDWTDSPHGGIPGVTFDVPADQPAPDGGGVGWGDLPGFLPIVMADDAASGTAPAPALEPAPWEHGDWGF